MFTKRWQNVQIQSPSSLRTSAESIPLSRLYDSGFFISAVFGSEAWVVNAKTFYAQPLRFTSNAPQTLSKGMITYNKKQYEKFLARQQHLASLLSKHQNCLRF